MTTILLCGQLFDGTGRDPQAEAAVVVRDGRVAWTGPAADLGRSERRDAEIVDARGHFVMPGLIDCHEHLIYPRRHRGEDLRLRHSIELTALKAGRIARILLHAGFTTVRDCGSQGLVAVAVRDAIRYGFFEGPRVIPSGPIVTSIGGLGDGFPDWIANPHNDVVTITGPTEILRVVRSQIKAGVENIKLGASGGEASPYSHSWLPTLNYEEMAAAVTEAHRLHRRVAAHAQAAVAIKDALRAGVDTIEHGTYLDEEAIDLFRRTGAGLVPTVSNLFSYLERGAAAGFPPEVIEECRQNRDPWLASVRLAREAGIPIAAGADLGHRYAQGENAVELEALVEHCGFSPFDALLAGTSVAARAIGLGTEAGSLEPGKRADLLVLARSPLDDIRVLRDRANLVTVVKGGRPVRAEVPVEVFPEGLPA
jgi:imidazolonepropionase-like amidohydrolase